MKMRNFTKTDWYAFAGAEGWSDTKPPLINDEPIYLEGYADDTTVVIIDQFGIGCYMEDGEYLHMNFSAGISHRLGKILGEALPAKTNVKELVDIGFIYPFGSPPAPGA